MHKVHRFYKEQNGGWFIDLPTWRGPKAALAMVAGADTFLDMLSDGENEVTLSLSTEPIEGYEQLIRQKLNYMGAYGADYKILSYKGIEFNHDVWLCPVTLYVFGEYPEIIYFTVA